MKAVAEARNVPLLEPAGIVSEAVTVRAVELELKAMIPPADPLRITVQVLEAPRAKVTGLHVTKLIEVVTGATLTLTVPPVPVTVTTSPVGDAPRVLLIVTGRALPPVQDRVLPAEDNAGPAAITVRPVTLVLGSLNVH